MKLKLVKGRSYSSGKVKVTKEKPIFETADDKLAAALIESGFFVAVSERLEQSSSIPVKNKPDGDKEPETNKVRLGIPLEKMTEPQLVAYAAEKGINLTGLPLKKDKLAKIQEFLKEAENNSGEVDLNTNLFVYGEV